MTKYQVLCIAEWESGSPDRWTIRIKNDDNDREETINQDEVLKRIEEESDDDEKNVFYIDKDDPTNPERYDLNLIIHNEDPRFVDTSNPAAWCIEDFFYNGGSCAYRDRPSINPQEVTDWSKISNADLWALDTELKEATEEKIRRSYNAIHSYNEYVSETAAEVEGEEKLESEWKGKRLALTNQILTNISGVNSSIVEDWIKTHTEEVISHNRKFGMQNTENLSEAETYNKRLEKEKIVKILNEVERKFSKKYAI
jgi:hypothetical protein